jgi:phage/conjugal plasmid C-4 type zinc finger TraR family protein
MDDADRAQQYIDELNDLALEEHRRKHNSPRPPLNLRGDGEAGGVTSCLDCGLPIPELRRQAAPGCTRCVPCQVEFEMGRSRRTV